MSVGVRLVTAAKWTTFRWTSCRLTLYRTSPEQPWHHLNCPSSQQKGISTRRPKFCRQFYVNSSRSLWDRQALGEFKEKKSDWCYISAPFDFYLHGFWRRSCERECIKLKRFRFPSGSRLLLLVVSTTIFRLTSAKQPASSRTSLTSPPHMIPVSSDKALVGCLKLAARYGFRFT